MYVEKTCKYMCKNMKNTYLFSLVTLNAPLPPTCQVAPSLLTFFGSSTRSVATRSMLVP